MKIGMFVRMDNGRRIERIEKRKSSSFAVGWDGAAGKENKK